MHKTQILSWIDIDLATRFRSQVPDRQRSQVINTLLRNYLEGEHSTEEAGEILAKIAEEDKILRASRDRRAQLSTKLAAVQLAEQERLRMMEEAAEKAGEFVASQQHSDPARRPDYPL